MKKFIIKSFALIFLVAFTVFGIIYLAPVSKETYLAATIEKHQLLAETPQPRIIFTGDSNLAFGLDSDIIHKATGYNIINMGLHGGLGLIYYLDELKPGLKKNDIVILALDYQNFYVDGSGTNSIVEITIFNPGIIRYYSRKNLISFVSYIPAAFQRRFNGFIRHIFLGKSHNIESRAFMRSGFNKYGDNIGHIGLPQPKFKTLDFVHRIIPKKIEKNTVKLLNNFHDKYAAQGIHTFITFPPLLINKPGKQKKNLAILYKFMKKNLKIVIIGKPQDFMYQKKYFFDNEFHLNGTGRELRTKDLLRAMRKVPLLKASSNLER